MFQLVFIIWTTIKNQSFIIYSTALMMRFLKPFLIFVVMYHIFVTVIGYGVLWWSYPQLPALGRDAIWVIFVAIIVAINFKTIKSYLRVRKRPRIILVILLSFSIGISLLKGKWMYDVFVGIKYGLLYIFIFLSSTFIGRLCSEKKIINILKFLKYLLITTLIVGFLRQGMKFLRPELFLKIGYGPLNDFKFWVKPPMYYLTGYQGTPRRQGIFSWPNNYGYFLIAFLSVIIAFFKTKFTTIKQFFSANKQIIFNTVAILLWILAIALTLSRTAFIWGIVILTFINIQWIKTHKKAAVWIGAIVLIGIIGVSILKWASTIGHIKAKFGSLQYVIDQPSGYGLWTSGPAVLHNGTILPENYYIQLMLDIGTIWFLIRTILVICIMGVLKKIQKTISNKYDITYQIRQGMNIWRLALLIMGIFLHVFEDSMVNYLFFVIWWILTGYLSTTIDKSFAIK